MTDEQDPSVELCRVARLSFVDLDHEHVCTLPADHGHPEADGHACACGWFFHD